MAEFGENLRKAREEMGVTQQTLADQLYVTRQAVSRWENGSRYPDLLTAKRLAAALDTSQTSTNSAFCGGCRDESDHGDMVYRIHPDCE